MPRRSDGDAYSPTRQDCGADFKSSGRTSLTDTISYALVPGPARQGDQEARQCRFLVLVGRMALSRCGQALYDPSAGLPWRECSLGVGVRFPVAGRRRTAAPEGSDRRQAPCVSAANVVSCEQPPPPCASCIARCSCPRTSPASPHSPPAFQRSSPSPSCFKQAPRPQDGRLLGS